MAPAVGRGRRQQRRLDTEARLVRAVGEVLRDRGVAGLGVNAVAEEAGVDKVLIYRYFGGLDALLEAYGRSEDFWPTLDDVLGPDREVLRGADPARVTREVLMRFARALRTRPVTLELLAWECVERSPLTIVLEGVRERWSDALYAEVARAGLPITPNLAALTGLLSGAINYLAIRGRGLSRFSALDIGDDEGWERLGDVIEAAVRALVEAEAAARPPR